MFRAGQQVITPDGMPGRIVALTANHVPRRIYAGDVCVPASVVLLETGEMVWYVDSALQPVTHPNRDAQLC